MMQAVFGLMGIAAFFGLLYYLVWLFVPPGGWSY